jgi:hypothetical protein
LVSRLHKVNCFGSTRRIHAPQGLPLNAASPRAKDGHLDLAVADSSGYFGLLLGNGDGTFQPERHFAVSGLSSYSLTAADFDGDGNLDIGLVNAGFPSDLLIVHGRGDGTFKPPVPYPVPYDSRVSAAASFTSSGAPDLAITAQDDDITVYLNTRDF